jgi:hypothetical protein
MENLPEEEAKKAGKLTARKIAGQILSRVPQKKGVAEFVSRKLGVGKVNRQNIQVIRYTPPTADPLQDRKQEPGATKEGSSESPNKEDLVEPPSLVQGHNKDRSEKLPASSDTSSPCQQQPKRQKLCIDATPIFAEEHQDAKESTEPIPQRDDTSGDYSQQKWQYIRFDSSNRE